METAQFQLFVVSSDQHLPSQTVDIDSEWTAIDLKKHLTKVYPGKPPIDSQKLIFAGRILSDDSKLRLVIGQKPISRTVHLVLSPSVANQVKAAMAAHKTVNYSLEDLSTLKAQYLQYLDNYYRKVESQDVSDTGDENVTINGGMNAEEELEREDESGLRRWVRALVFRPIREPPEVQNEELNGEDPFDLLDFAYAVFRISILVAICGVYASWQRMTLVAIVGFYLYWRNGARQNEARRRRDNQPAPTRAQTHQRQQETTQDNVDPSTSAMPSSAGSTTPAAVDTTSNERVIVAEQSRVSQIAGALRAAGSTSVRLVCAIFSSLVPELPAGID